MRTIILDLHGVLVDSKRVKENYEIYLTKLYAGFNISKQKAVEYHKMGLKYFLKSINKIKSKNLIDKQFLKEMKNADTRWDNLMRNPVNNEENKSKILQIESRYIEEKSGKIRNVFYPDAEDFLKYWLEKLQSQYNLVITSNSHYSHIKGVISGLNEKILNKITIYGWDATKCMKSHPKYFLRLKNIIKDNLKSNYTLIMIGNSDDEITGSSKEKMLPILINRGNKITDNTFKKALKTFNSLEGVWDFIFTLN